MMAYSYDSERLRGGGGMGAETERDDAERLCEFDNGWTDRHLRF